MMTTKQHKQWCKDLAELHKVKAENKKLREVILLVPGSNEKDFLKKYNDWWDTYYREIRTPGCNLLTIDQALKMTNPKQKRQGL